MQVINYPEENGVAYFENHESLISELILRVFKLCKNNEKVDKLISIGFDTREDSEKLANACAKILSENGIKINISKESIPTPVLKYFTYYSKSFIGIMITGGALKSGWNGFKLYDSNSEALQVSNNIVIEFNKPIKNSEIIISDMLKNYLEYIKSVINLEIIGNYGKTHESVESILIDSMGGTGKTIIEDVVYELGWRVQTLFGGPLNSFYDRTPEISIQQIEPISYNVNVTDAIIGIMLNGDCSEAGIVNEDGNFIPKNKISELINNYYKPKSDDILNNILQDGILSSLIILEIICKKGKDILNK